MSDVTPHLGLPLIAAGQAQKHVTHNEALAMLDGLIQLACLDKDLTSPPANPTEGDRYLVAAANPAGAWAGLTGQVVRFTDGVWVGAVPSAGWLAYLADEKLVYVFDGQSWGPMASSAVLPSTVDRLGIGAQPDATNRFAVKTDAALLSWDDATPGSGDLRITVNKKAAAKDAGFVFQTGWSSRALFGTLGGDDFALKTSPDGSTFRTAFTVAASTGLVSFGASPVAPTPAAADNSSRLATTAYVDRAVSGVDPGTGWVLVADADYAARATDRTLVLTKLTAPRVITLPAAAGLPPGKTVAVFDQTGACALGRSITVRGAPRDTILGNAFLVLNAPYASVTLQTDGIGRWSVLSRTPVSLASTFVDVGKTSDPQPVDGTFRRIKMTLVTSDFGNNWDSVNSLYTCPRAGIYMITARFRIMDGMEAGTQYGVGVSTAEADGPWFFWHFTGTGKATRGSFDYSRLTYQNAGDQLRMSAFADPPSSADSARLQICLVSETS